MAEAPRILLEHHLKRLKLPTFLREYEKLARQCAAEGLDHVQFLARLVELELIDRERRLVERRIKQAGFPVVKQLESFDFKAIPGLNKMLVLDLARGEYIDRRENVILLGPSGVGKTHVALALGLAACPPRSKWTRSQMSDSEEKSGAGLARPVARRRRWSEGDRLRIVAESYRPGVSVSVVARRNDVNANLLFTWRRRYSKRAVEAGSGGLVPVVVEPGGLPPRPMDSVEGAALAAGRMEIALADGSRVIVDREVDGYMLKRWGLFARFLDDGRNLKEDLPPMPQFLNRLLALPIDEQNQLFGALETRIEANIEIAIEAGTFERGVETIAADSLSVASRETVFTHEGSGAETEIVEVARKDRLEPLGADAAIELHAATSRKPPLLIVNGQSKRAAMVMDAPARTLDDGDVQERVRLVRPATRETIAQAALDASNWRRAHGNEWRALWDAEIAGLPSHRESRFWLVAGLLLPIWDRLPDESMRVRRLVADDGEHLIGRVLGPAEVSEFRAALGLDCGPGLTAAEVHDEIMVRGASFPLANGWKLARRRLMGAMRIEIEGPTDSDTDALKRMGCIAEIVSWRTRLFAPDRATLERITDRWPIAAPDTA